MSPTVFRHESFLFALPFHCGLYNGFGMHFEDAPRTQRTTGWEHFALGAYLGFGPDPLPDDLPSTTLLFATAPGQPVDPFFAVEQAWPRIFAWQRRLRHGRLGTLRYSRPLLALDRLRRGHALRQPVSVVQAIRLAPRPQRYDESWRWEQFDKALEHLNELLAGVMTVSRDLEVTSIGRRDLPPLVFGFGWDLTAGGDRSPVAWQTYLPHDRIAHIGSELSAEEATLAAWIANTRGDPFNASRGYLLAAWSSAQRGRFTHAVAESGTAVEVLVSAALRAAASIKGYDATKLGNVLDGPFASRLKDHFAPCFGYERDPLSSSDRLGEWWQKGYSLPETTWFTVVFDLRSRRP